MLELKEHIAEQRVQMGGLNNSAEQAIKVRAHPGAALWQAAGGHPVSLDMHLAGGPALQEPPNFVLLSFVRVQLQRKIKILEDRLQGASVRYNDSLTRSRKLRARIDSLRCERLLFEELHRKLQREAGRKKTEIMQLIARIAASHEAQEKVGGCPTTFGCCLRCARALSSSQGCTQ